MTLSLDGACERIHAPGHSIVECVSAVWTYKHKNGYTVALRGPLTVHVVATADDPTVLKFERFEFESYFFDKSIALESIAGFQKSLRTMDEPLPRIPIEHGSLPSEPVNAFGIPQAAMRCLEVTISGF